MKRCSECDFIYEDDQHLCDMDGHELVYEQTLQSLQIVPTTAATKPSAHPILPRGRRLVLMSTTAVLIGTVLSVGYSGFTREYVPQNATDSSTTAIQGAQAIPDQIPAATATTPVTTDSPEPAPSYSPRSDKTRVPGNRTTTLARSTPHFPSTTRKRESLRSGPPKANLEKQSGLSGFLKKTKRILKRPFKF